MTYLKGAILFSRKLVPLRWRDTFAFGIEKLSHGKYFKVPTEYFPGKSQENIVSDRKFSPLIYSGKKEISILRGKELETIAK